MILAPMQKSIGAVNVYTYDFFNPNFLLTYIDDAHRSCTYYMTRHREGTWSLRKHTKRKRLAAQSTGLNTITFTTSTT